MRDLGLADEDSVALDDRRSIAETPDHELLLDIAVLRLPRISNFDDMDALRAEPGVGVRFVSTVEELGTPDLIIVPGTKTTIADLELLRQHGLAQRIVQLAQQGVAVLGICGGYQMLGQLICDPDGVESGQQQVAGLGLLPLVTTFASEKQTVRVTGRVLASRGLFARASRLPVEGYEIHMGRTVAVAEAASTMTPLVEITTRGESVSSDGETPVDGMLSADGWIAGTYLHGFFDKDALRHTMLGNLAARKGMVRSHAMRSFDREAAYERMASAVREHLDLAAIYKMVG